MDKTLRYFTDEQGEYLKTKMNEIQRKATILKNQKLEPTIDEYRSAMEVILEFIKRKKRKIYGGFALNEMIKSKDKNAGIYTSDDIADIEFYSNEPIADLYDLCNALDDKGFKAVEGSEAQHVETYTIYVNFRQICDISYVPTYVYNYMSTYEYNGFSYIHPHFMLIDYFRMINDPLTSYWRIEKAFGRMLLLDKYFPLYRNTGQINIALPSEKIRQILVSIKTEFLESQEHSQTLIMTGHEAYNYYLQKSNVKKASSYLCNVPFLEFISVEYVQDTVDMYNYIKNYLEPLGESHKLHHTEYYPLFQFTGYKSVILLDDVPIVVIYYNNNMCIPYNKVSLTYKDGKTRVHQMGTFSYTIMMLMFNSFRSRMIRDKDAESTYKTMISNLIEIRNKYFEENKITLLDSSPYQEFKLQCIGRAMDQGRKAMLKRIAKKEQGKNPRFSYRPYGKNPEEKVPRGKFSFANTAGNIIEKEKYKKVNVLLPLSSQNKSIETDDEDNGDDDKKEDKKKEDSK